MKKWLKWLLIVAAVMLLLVVVAYAYVSRGGFIQSHVLPIAAKQLGLPVTASDASFSVPSILELQGLTVGEPGDPLLKAGTVRVRYDLWAILGKRLVVKEVYLSEVAIVADDAKLAALQQRLAKPAGAPEPAPSTASGPPDIAIEVYQVQVKNLSVQYTGKLPDGRPLSVKLSGLNADLPMFRLGQDFTLTVQQALAAKVGTEVDATLGSIKTEIVGRINAQFQPEAISIKSTVDQLSGTVAGLDLAGRTLALDLATKFAGTAITLERVKFTESLRGTIEADLQASGTLTPAPLAADLKLSANLPGPGLLNLVGGLVGDYQFGQTTLSYTGAAQVTEAQASLKGSLAVQQFTLASAKLGVAALAPLAISSEHEVAFRQAEQRVLAKQLTLAVKEGSKELLTVLLAEPLDLKLADLTAAADTRLLIQAKDFDLTMLKPLLPAAQRDLLQGGIYSSELALTLSEGGKLITLAGQLGLEQLKLRTPATAATPTSPAVAGVDLTPLRVRQQLDLRIREARSADLRAFDLELSALGAGQPSLLLSTKASGQFTLPAAKTATLPASVLGGELTLQVQANGQALGGVIGPVIGGDLDLGQTTVAYQTVVKVGDGAKTLAASGHLTVRELTVASRKLNLAALTPLGLSVVHKLSLTPDSGALTLDKLDLILRDASREIVTVALPKPLALNLKTLTATEDGSLTVKVDRFDLAMLKPLLPAAQRESLQGGSVNGDWQLNLSNNGQLLALTGTLGVDQLRLRQGDTVLPVLRLAQDLNLQVRDGRLAEIKQLSVELFRLEGQRASSLFKSQVAGRVTLPAAASGTTPASVLGGELSLAVQALGRELGAVAGPFLDADLDLGQTALAYQATLKIGPEAKTLDADGTLTVSELTVASKKLGISALAPLALSVTHGVGVAPEAGTLNLRALGVSLRDASREIVTLTLAKPLALNLNQLDAGGDGDLTLRIADFDLAMLKPLLPTAQREMLLAGSYSAKLDLGFKGGVKLVTISGTSTLADLRLNLDGKHLPTIRQEQTLGISIAELKQVTIRDTVTRLLVSAGGAPVEALKLSTSGALTLKPALGGDLQVQMSGTGSALAPLATAFVGQLDLGATALTGDFGVKLANGGKDLVALGKLRVNQFTAALPARQVPALAPLDLSVDYDVAWAGQTETATINALQVLAAMAGRQAPLLAVAVTPGKLSLAELKPGAPASNAAPLAATITVTDLGLDLARPFVPADLKLTQLGGSVSAALKAGYLPSTQAAVLSGNFSLAKLQLALTDGPALSQPLNLTSTVDAKYDGRAGSAYAKLDLAATQIQAKVPGVLAMTEALTTALKLEALYAKNGVITLTQGQVQVSTTADKLLEMALTGTLESSLAGKEESRLTLTSTSPVLADKLEAVLGLVKKPASETTPAPPPSTPPSRTPPAGLNPWLTLLANIPELRYREIQSALVTQVSIKDWQVHLPSLDLKLNDGKVALREVKADLRDFGAPGYSGQANIQNIVFEPILRSLQPGTKDFAVGGGLKSATATFAGKGYDLPALQQHLTTAATFELDKLQLKQTASEGFSWIPMIMGIFGVTWDELNFASGRGKIGIDRQKYGDRNIHIDELALQHDQLFLGISGLVEFGGKWQPNVNLGTAFAGRLADNARQRRIPLKEPAVNGYFTGPTVNIYGDLTDTRHVTKLVGIITAKLAADYALAEASKRAGMDVGGIAGGLLDAIGGKKKDPAAPAPAPTPTPTPAPTPKEGTPPPATEAPKTTEPAPAAPKKDPVGELFDLFNKKKK